MLSGTTPVSRLQVKIFVQHQTLGKAPWEVAELSKNTLVLKAPVSPSELPEVTLWMRALGRDSWRPFPLKSLRPLPSPDQEESAPRRFTFEVDEHAEFSRCFDFSRLHR